MQSVEVHAAQCHRQQSLEVRLPCAGPKPSARAAMSNGTTKVRNMGSLASAETAAEQTTDVSAGRIRSACAPAQYPICSKL